MKNSPSMFKSYGLSCAVVAAGSLFVGQAGASPIANWKQLVGSGSTSGLNTDDPTFGDGTAGSAQGQFAGRFGTVGSPASVSLGIGDTLSVSGNVVLTGGNNPADVQYRFGVYNDGGQFAAGSQNNWAGGWLYAIGDSLYQARTDGSFVSTGGNAAGLAPTKVSTGTFDGDSTAPFVWTIEVTRDSATTVDLVATLTGGDGTIDQVYTKDDITTSLFDYTAAGVFFANGSGLDQAAFSNVQYNVDLAVVPEPASLALLGLGGFAALSRRRRR